MNENGVQIVTIGGQRFAILPEAEYLRLADGQEPTLPASDKRGHYPAVETARVVLARKIIRRRRAAGLTQEELARRAGVRLATLERLEKATSAPSVSAVDKLDRALTAAESQ